MLAAHLTKVIDLHFIKPDRLYVLVSFTNAVPVKVPHVQDVLKKPNQMAILLVQY